MLTETTHKKPNPKVSEMAENLIGSEIIKLAAEINKKIKAGQVIDNFTIGDFDPAIFPIPADLNKAIQQAYADGETNYPPANGVLRLRKAASEYIKKRQGLEYDPEDFLISGGARPLIYAIYSTVLDPGDSVIFPVPSWNNNHYTHLHRSKQICVEARPENNFMPTAADIAPHISEAYLIALCSPLNPTGTVFSKSDLEQICDLVLEENKRRAGIRKPLYLMYDQIYWTLTFGETKHYDPVSLRPEMRDYTIFVDGISKSFAATGVRVGWAFGPHKVMSKMKAILSHVGAWSPKAEQVATAKFIADENAVDTYLDWIKEEVILRLNLFYKGFMELKQAGFNVDAITPQAAIYLTAKIDLRGKTTKEGKLLESMSDVTTFLIDEANLALVPFTSFGASDDSPWYRLSVGTCPKESISDIFARLRNAMASLS